MRDLLAFEALDADKQWTATWFKLVERDELIDARDFLPSRAVVAPLTLDSPERFWPPSRRPRRARRVPAAVLEALDDGEVDEHLATMTAKMTTTKTTQLRRA